MTYGFGNARRRMQGLDGPHAGIRGSVPACGESRRARGPGRMPLLPGALVAWLFCSVAFASNGCPTQWTATPVQPPSGGQPASAGISFSSPSDGWFVGNLTDASNTLHPLAEYWDSGSGSWLPGSPVDPPGSPADRLLDDVISFPPANGADAEAWAVGSWNNPPRMLIEHWTGPDPTAQWMSVTPQNPPTQTTLLFGIAGAARDNLWAVGATRNGASEEPQIEHYDGTGWTGASAPPPPGSASAALIGATADGVDDVWAVGYQSDGYGYRALIEHYDGTGWSIASAVPNPGTAYDVLTAVAAASPQDVWAVGYQGDGEGYAPLVLHYDGQGWSAISNPGVFGLQDILLGVAVVPSSASVVAGGFGFDPQLGTYTPYSETWPESNPAQITFLPLAQSNNGQTLGKSLGALAVEPSSGEVWASVPPPAIAETVCLGGGRPSRNEPPRPVSAARLAPETTRFPPSRLPRNKNPRGRRRAAAGAGLVVAQDITANAFAGAIPLTKTYGEAVADFAGPGSAGPDGYDDFELGRHGSAPLELWVSRGDGTFERIDSSDFSRADRHHCAWGDVGSPTAPVADGLPDLFCAIGAGKGLGHKVNELWIQKPDGSFMRAPLDPTDYPDLALMDPFGRGRAPVFFYAGDARQKPPHPLSLFLGEDTTRKDGLPGPNRFFLNQGGVLVSAPAAGLDREVGGACAQASDYDDDGYADLLVCTSSNGGAGLALYHNDGPTGPGGVPQFSDVTAAAGIQATGARFGLLVDLNGDGCADLVAVYVHRLDVDLQDAVSGACLGSFQTAWSRSLDAGDSVAAGDVNGDGAPDLYVMQSQPTPDLMLINGGDGTSFSSVPIPQITSGQAGGVFALTDAVTGTSDFLVLDGGHSLAGPVRLIHFAPNPAPDPLTITSAPPAQTVSTDAAFSFQSTESGVSFACSLDGADPEPCTSPVSYSDLAPQDHAFAVWSIKANGDVSAEATDAWTIIQDHAPTAENGSVQTQAGASVNGQLLASDPDPGQTLSYAAATQPAHGSLQLDEASGAFTYTPADGFSGSDAFTFTASDGYLTSNAATESIAVAAIQNHAPTAENGSVQTQAGASVNGQLLASDPDPGQTLSYAAATQPAHGSLQLDEASGAFTYTPADGFSGSDAFTFTASDGYLTSNAATESIAVAAPAPPPQGGGSSGGGGAANPLWLGLLLAAVGLRRLRASRSDRTRQTS